MTAGSHDVTKRRTREHVIADLSVHFLEGFILEEGHHARRLDSDYSYDLVMRTFDEGGFAEPGAVYFQVKASDNPLFVDTDIAYDIDIRDFNLWVAEESPVFLVLFDAKRRKAYWLYVQEYVKKEFSVRPVRGAKSIRFRISTRNVVTRKVIRRSKC